MVVFVLPVAKSAPKVVRVTEGGAPIELVLVGSVASFDLAVAFGTARRNVAVRDPEVV